MKKLFKRLFIGSLITLLVLISLASFLIYTTPGLYAVIKLASWYLPGSITITQLHGRFVDRFTIAQLEYHYQGNTIKISGLNVNWRLQSLSQPLLQIQTLTADTIQLQKNKPQILTNLYLTGKLSKATLSLDMVKVNYLNQTLSNQLDLSLTNDHHISGQIKLNPATKNTEQLTGNLSIYGTLQHLKWTGAISGAISCDIKGSLISLSQLEQVIKWRDLGSPLTHGLSSPEGKLTISGTLPHVRIHLLSKLNSTQFENWQLAAHAEGTLPWKWTFNTKLTQPLDASSKHQGLYTHLSLNGALTDKNNGHFIFSVSPGHYQMPDNSPFSSLEFKGGTLKAYLSPEQLTAAGSLTIDANKKLNVALKLPHFDVTQFSPAQVLDGELSLIIDSFDFLKNISPDFSQPKGIFTASLKAKGTLAKPHIESKLALSKGSLSLPRLGLHLNPVDLTLVGKKKHWEASGTIVNAGKRILLAGKGPMVIEPQGSLSLQGSEFPIINTPQYQINVSPQVELNFTPTSLAISGTILVPVAHLKPQYFSNSLVLSDDVIFKKQKEKAPSSGFSTTMDINLTMGEEVELTLKGLHAMLAGTVLIKQKPHGPITANGELTVKEGEYKAYGQDLDIEQGQLLFTGGRLDNPGINLRAAKTIKNTSTTFSGSNDIFDFNSSNLQTVNIGNSINVGVEVTGRIKEPKIQLFSNPAILSQADILSMLVLGRPASQANKAGAQLLLTAITSMNLGAGTNGAQLIEQLKQNLGFDVNVQSNTNYNQLTNQSMDSTAVVVGKSLSKRIYLSYNVGISQADPNVLTLKYLLNKFLSIQVSSSDTGNGIDFLYTATKP